MPAFASLASLLLASGTFASLDLCADEYLLMFARRDQIASVSHLAANPDDSVLASRTNGLPTNRGTLESLLRSGAKTLFTTRPLARIDRALTQKLGIRVVTLNTGGPAEVSRAVSRVAWFTGHPAKAETWQRRYERLNSDRPQTAIRALWIGPGGVGMNVEGSSGQWLALAGIAPIEARAGVSRVEQIVSAGVPLVLRSTYRDRHYSLGGAALVHPLVRMASGRQIAVDGRPFLCSGPAILDEIERLREIIQK